MRGDGCGDREACGASAERPLFWRGEHLEEVGFPQQDICLLAQHRLQGSSVPTHKVGQEAAALGPVMPHPGWPCRFLGPPGLSLCPPSTQAGDHVHQERMCTSALKAEPKLLQSPSLHLCLLTPILDSSWSRLPLTRALWGQPSPGTPVTRVCPVGTAPLYWAWMQT